MLIDWKPISKIIKQIEKHKTIFKKGVIIDISVIDASLKTNRLVTHKVAYDREDEKEVEVKKYVESVDKDTSWIKKNCKQPATIYTEV